MFLDFNSFILLHSQLTEFMMNKFRASFASHMKSAFFSKTEKKLKTEQLLHLASGECVG
jgi:hypothetical protein